MGEKWNCDIGIAYDDALFITAYFREDDYLTMLRNRFGKTEVDEAMQGYFDFKERHKSVVFSREIAPFVYSNYSAGLCGFLISAICDKLDFQEHTKDGITLFLQNRELKRLFWEHQFPHKKDRIAERIITNDSTLRVPDVISQLNMPEDIKYSLIDMSYDFPKYQRELVEAFREVYPLSEEYRLEKQSVIAEIKSQIDDNLLKRLRSIYKLPDAVSLTFYCSLLNGLLIDYRSFNKKVCFGLGLHFKEAIDRVYRYDHVSSNSYGKVVHVETRAQMLDMFLKYKRLCASEIADSVKVARTTIHQHLNYMRLEGMIKYTDSDTKSHGERVYFTINSEYFKVYAGLTADINQKASEISEKGIESYDLPRKKRKAKDGLIYNENDEYNEEDLD